MSGGHQVGGYPIFTQSDPHDDRDPLWNKATDLLLQIDSTDDVSFGDSGVANFFISPAIWNGLTSHASSTPGTATEQLSSSRPAGRGC